MNGFWLVLLEPEAFIRLHAFYNCLCFKENLNKSANNASLTPAQTTTQACPPSAPQLWQVAHLWPSLLFA